MESNYKRERGGRFAVRVPEEKDGKRAFAMMGKALRDAREELKKLHKVGMAYDVVFALDGFQGKEVVYRWAIVHTKLGFAKKED